MPLLTMAVSSSSPSVDNPPTGDVWHEFCDRHARAGAVEFARNFRVFVTEHPRFATSAARREFGERFVEQFMDSFMNGCEAASSPCLDRPTVLRFQQNGIARSRTLDCESPDNYSGCSDTEPDGPKNRRPFLRRLSFKNIRRGIFQKQNSDEVALKSPPHYDKVAKGQSTKRDCKTSKIVVEIKKEGLVSFLCGEDSDGKAKWEKCRLMLVKTAGGYMLEFYTPLKPNSKTPALSCGY
ncbi:PREDICTED: SH2B adapter protein 2-like [Priapulus caudatus]|uniref:SH2B adapter protein 2-like n=1 Tax=Priapulus caudatus TaxID=37621 RepID=A0ABM1EGF0_PRICU|nr:PREDICTED: SH2B adapter protein 2-like [Priapulus caudatus]